MINYVLFLYMLFMGACFQPIYAMEPVARKDEKNGVVVDMNHFWPSDYSKNINEIKDIDLKAVRLNLKKENYLSPHANALEHLLYLSTIRKNNAMKTSFTQKQQAKFDIAFEIKRSVPWVFVANSVVICLTALLPFTNFTGLSQCSNTTQAGCLSQTSVIITPTTISVAGTFMAGFVSLYATGILTERAARKANKVQDEIGHLSHKYATIAKYWIDIYFKSPEQAKQAEYIADKFDIEELKRRVQLKTHKNKLGNSLVNPLEEAWHFIKHNTILVTFTEIENYLYNKIHCRQLEDFVRRITFLEQEKQINCKHIEDCIKRIEFLEKVV